jgi:ribonuclease J
MTQKKPASGPVSQASTGTAPVPKPRRSPLPERSIGKMKIMPLGGLGQIGMNMMLYEYGEDIYIVDCGQMIPDDELPGIDMVIPDLNFVADRADRVRAILITHSHEDHIGALPYLLRHVKVPIYASALACAMIRERLKEHGLDRSTEFVVVEPRDVADFGEISVEFLHVTHSIPQCLALAFRLPFGNIIHTGDFKIDMTPPDGNGFDFQALAAYGEEGVLALLSDSTNVESEGYSGSEQDVREPLRKLIAAAPRAVVVSCFSSSLHRIQIIIDCAAQCNRRVFAAGLNMNRNIRLALELGILKFPPNLVSDIREIRKTPPEQRLILCTGSQGEPMSALSKMALDEHRDMKLEFGDTVILSSRIIPGNEKSIYQMINHLFRRGAEVHYRDISGGIHVSGHAHRQELRTMISLTKPKYLIPIHGEFRHLVEHKHLGVEMGIDPEKIFILQNGDVVEMDADGAARGGRIPVSRILVDGNDVGLDDIVLHDRKNLAEDGMVMVMLVVDKTLGTLVAGPDIVSRGFLYMDQNLDFFDECKDVASKAFEECEKESREEWQVVKTAVRRALKRFIKSETNRFPVILPVVLEV